MDCSPLTRESPIDGLSRAVDLCQTVVDSGLSAVEPFYTDDCCDVLGYVSHGVPAIDRVDVVVAWVDSIGLQPQRQAPCVMTPTVDVITQFWMGCWPDEMTVVERDVIGTASKRAGVAGETWYVRTVDLVRRAHNVGCAKWRIGVLTPINPQGLAVAWQFRLTVDLNVDV